MRLAYLIQSVLALWLAASASAGQISPAAASVQTAANPARQFIVVNISGGSKAAVFEAVAREFNPTSEVGADGLAKRLDAQGVAPTKAVLNCNTAKEAQGPERQSAAARPPRATSEVGFKAPPSGPVQVGIAAFFSYLQQKPEQVRADLLAFLRLSEQYDIPVVVQLDGEQWWGGRPDLWNWWDAKAPGYNPSNRFNVEWSGWRPEDALRIAWRNWGRQIRVLPPPNLMSPSYRQACHEGMRDLIPVVVDWWRKLPEQRQDLFIGLKVGWESSIGVNAYYYPEGNQLAERPAAEDPVQPIQADQLPGRGYVPIGYAAVSMAGLANAGELKEEDLVEVVRRHLEYLSKLAAELGVPRQRLFTHIGGWKEDELLYQAALNRFACPGWSFYRHARNPAQDAGVRKGLQKSDAPGWAAVEWLPMGANTENDWRQALGNTLGVPKCRYLCIYNWDSIAKNQAAIAAIRGLVGRPNAPLPK